MVATKLGKKVQVFKEKQCLNKLKECLNQTISNRSSNFVTKLRQSFTASVFYFENILVLTNYSKIKLFRMKHLTAN